MGRVILLLWLYPLLEGSFAIIGLGMAVLRKRKLGASGATEAIIQITTIGNYDTVNEIIAAVRGYDLPFPYAFWVVVEPGVENRYVGADEVLMVPEDFVSLARYKARAQDYSRRVRLERGLNRRDVKIIMLDDDSLPTRKYFIDVFGADYDVCEGVLTPRRGYGRFLTHIDDLRTFNCLTICSFWQGIGHPIWVHGEGLTLRGSAESAVTWNYPVVASEDLTVGHNAVERGLSWGFVWEYVQLTSPFSWHDMVVQRRRWIWGNLYALRTGLLPPLGTALTGSRPAYMIRRFRSPGRAGPAWRSIRPGGTSTAQCCTDAPPPAVPRAHTHAVPTTRVSATDWASDPVGAPRTSGLSMAARSHGTALA